jgi:hypothetical protein
MQNLNCYESDDNDIESDIISPLHFAAVNESILNESQSNFDNSIVSNNNNSSGNTNNISLLNSTVSINVTQHLSNDSTIGGRGRGRGTGVSNILGGGRGRGRGANSIEEAFERSRNDPLLPQLYGHDQVQLINMIEINCEKARKVYNKFNSFFNYYNGVGNQQPPKLRETFQLYEAFSMLNPFQFRQISLGENGQFDRTNAEAFVNTIITKLPILFNLENNQKEVLRLDLMKELPSYFVHSQHVQLNVDVLVWWFNMRDHLPVWYENIIPLAVAFQPTSAAAERVFSMLNWMFHDNQEGLLGDHKLAAMIMRYNDSWRRDLHDE